MTSGGDRNPTDIDDSEGVDSPDDGSPSDSKDRSSKDTAGVSSAGSDSARSNPDEATRNGGTPRRDGDPTSEALEVTYEEAKRALEHQLGNISDLDDKAAHTVRVLFLLFGLLITSISVVVRAIIRGGAEMATAKQFVNLFTVSGVVCLLFSLLAAIWTYSETETRPGPNPEEIAAMRTEDVSRSTRLQTLLDANHFQRWLWFNQIGIRKDSTLLFYSHLLLLLGITMLLTGVIAVAPFDVGRLAFQIPLPIALRCALLSGGALLVVVGIIDAYSAYMSIIVFALYKDLDRGSILMVGGTILMSLGVVVTGAHLYGVSVPSIEWSIHLCGR